MLSGSSLGPLSPIMHSLSHVAVQVVTAAGLAAKHVPAGDYEQEIAALLQEAGHSTPHTAAQVLLLLLLPPFSALFTSEPKCLLYSHYYPPCYSSHDTPTHPPPRAGG